MSRRPTIADVALTAGVSTATVDRVINKRRPVKQATAEAVLNASRQLNFHRTPLVAERMNDLLPKKRLGFVLQKSSKPFYLRFADAIRRAVAALPDVRGRAEVRFVEQLAPEQIADAMRDLAKRVDSLAVVAVDHPLVSDEISRLKRQGLPVWALLSDLTSPDRAGFIGIDSRKAGRTAAWAFDKHCRSSGTIGTLIGSHRYIGHEDRDAGMRAYFREKQQRFRVLQAISYHDNEEGAYDGTVNLLDRVPDLTGLHVIGGGSEGAIRALKAKAVAGKVALVCHELNDETRKGLIEGSAIMVLATPIQRIASAAARLLAAQDNGNLSGQVAPVLPFEIFISENV